MSGRSKLIFALDVDNAADALAWVSRLSPYVGCFKFGLELFVAQGPALVRQIAAQCPVFLDLKLHDIPATVAAAAKAAQDLGVMYLTVHADEAGRAAAAAVERAPNLKILMVTVLTSEGSVGDTNALVQSRALLAKQVGCAGVVCSGLEAASVRQVAGADILIVTPGIRLTGGATHDQKRVVTPQAAIHAGADLLVIGRPIRDASDPVAVARQIAASI